MCIRKSNFAYRSEIFHSGLVLCLLLFLQIASASSPPSVFLLSPEAGHVFNTTNNISLQCNATSGSFVGRLDLYADTNGTFSTRNSSCFGEICEDSSTMLLMHFNNDSAAKENDSFVYDWSRNGNNANVSIPSPEFNATGGKFSGAFEFNGDGAKYMRIRHSSSLNLGGSGTIEFWLYPRSTTTDAYIFTKAPSATCTESAYAIILTQGYIEMDFGSNTGDYTYTDTMSALSADQWSHVAATWNSSGVVIYVNGVSSGAILSDGRAGTPHNETNIVNNINDLWIATTDQACTLAPGPYYLNPDYFNGKIDELAIYSRELSAGEISEHYARNPTNNATANWTINSVPDGTYSWNCKALDNESQSAWAGGNRTFYVDLATPPAVNSVTLSPNSTEDVDPGVTLTVIANITDASGVSSAILQYKNPNEGFFRNATMAYDGTSKSYNASFTPPVSDNGVWKYRIWSNDTLGNFGTSNETNVSVEFDRTWTLSVINATGGASYGFGTISALNGSTVQIGIITINNTGDTLLNFDLSGSPSILTYNASEPFDLYSRNATSIKVYAAIPQQEGEWPVQVMINTTLMATPSSAAVNGILVPFKGGPYISVSIQGYEANVAHNQEVNLSARIKNLGNETATGVWANWTLPQGWDVTSGNKSAYLGNITNSSEKWSNITARVNATVAAPGTFQNGISITARSTENATNTDSKTVSVICKNSDSICGNGCGYSADNDCPQPSGGSTTTVVTSSSGMISVIGEQSYDMDLIAPEEIHAYRGEKAMFRVAVSNPEKGSEIENVILAVSGYPQVHISIRPSYIGAFYYGETKQFDVEIEVPAYMKYGARALTITATGEGKSASAGNATLLNATKEAKLIIHSLAENETLSAMKDAGNILAKLAELDISTPKLLLLLESANASLQEWDYDAAREYAESALDSATRALKSHELIARAGGMISEADKYGVDASETKKMYALAEAAFMREDYARAEERATGALLTASLETGDNVRLLKFMNENSKELIIAVAILAYIFHTLNRRAKLSAAKAGMKHYENEEKSIRSLIGKAKQDYFVKRETTKADYTKAMHDYENRLNEIKKARNSLVIKMAGLMEPKKVIEQLKSEEKRILASIEEVQRDYFEKRKISNASYNTAMRELRAELAEIKMETELASEKIKKDKPKSLLLALLLTAILFGGHIAYAASSAESAQIAINQADAYIKEMQAQGFGTALANDTVKEARLLFAKGNYAGAETLARNVGTLKETAVKVNLLIDDAEARIYDASAEGLDVSEPKKIFDEGLAAFGNSEYARAEELVNLAISKTDEMQSLAATEGAISGSPPGELGAALKRNWKIAAASLAALGALALFFGKEAGAARKGKKIKRLESEINAASKMMQETQRGYFELGKISKLEYSSGMKRYREIILSAKKEISLLKGEGIKQANGGSKEKAGQAALKVK